MLTFAVLVAWHYSAQLVLTGLVAALLSGFYRVFRRPYLQHWAISWGAYAVFRAAVAVGVGFTQLPRSDPARLVSAVVMAVASSAQVVSLLQGTWEVSHGREAADGGRRWPILAFVVLSALQTASFLAGPPGDPAGVAVSSLGRMLIVAVTALTAAVWIWGAPAASDPINRRMLPTALILWAASSLAVFGIALTQPSNVDRFAASLIFVDLVVQGLLAIATVSWLLGEERARESERANLQSALRHSETMAALGNLVGGVAHEVRNPLFGISSTVDALATRLADRADVAPHLASLRSEVSRLNALMQDLLDYGRPTTQKIVRGSLAEVAAEAARATAPLAEARRVSVELRLDEKLPVLLMDRRRMVQVFHNLVDNAIRHSPEGGTVSIHATPAGRHGKPCVLCSVEDNGVGFPPGDETRVFEPFFTRRRGGTGLGLAIVQRVIEQHGGSVVASNRPRGGARLAFTLPLEEK